MATFKDRLKLIRREKNLTLDKLAEDLNTTKATLSRYENGLREPKVDFLNQLANYLDVSIDYLLGRTDDRENNLVGIPDELKELGVEYLGPVKEAKKYDITPEELQTMIEAIKKIKKDD